MPEERTTPDENVARQPEETALEGGAYEVLRSRLLTLNTTLCDKLDKLNERRKEVFGGLETQVVGSERIVTDNNCVPRDIIGVGNLMIFGYNVFLGLRSETGVKDVFSVHRFDGATFQPPETDPLSDEKFVRDFTELYRYYRNARFLQFVKDSARLLMVFQVGETTDDIKVFRFRIARDGSLTYVDDRGEMDYTLPPQRAFEWTATTREDQVQGMHPHISIADRVFVECIEGDLTIKVEDNTEVGEGIYSEPVENPDQTLDDALISYAVLEPLILLRIRPYREERFRHFVFNTRTEEVVRIDSIEHTCIGLPEEHGIIFPKGYYLENGTMRLFEEDVEGMVFLECVKSPNGEDFLYIFYHVQQGRHVLLQYNLITKALGTPLTCHGFSLHDDGKMVVFSAPDSEPRRNHPMQIWQTPFYSDTYAVTSHEDTYLGRVGNRDLVRGISEGYALSRLVSSEHIDLVAYREIIRAATNLLDGYHWIDHQEAFQLKDVVAGVRQAAIAAVDEYEKVVRIREDSERRIRESEAAVRQAVLDYAPDRLLEVDAFVEAIGQLRARRGEVISLKELKYADTGRIDALDESLEHAAAAVSAACVEFLLRPNAFDSYQRRDQEIEIRLRDVTKVAELENQSKEVEKMAERLDLLTDVIGNLDVDDATKTTRIVDAITEVYAAVNRTRAVVRNLRKELGSAEAKAEFAAQYKLLSQTITNYIGMCDTPAKCDELLTKIMVTIEELDGRFADYQEYAEQLAEKREEAYNAFSNRKQVLDEEKKRRVGALEASAGRILRGAANRAATFATVAEVNAYFASDLMVSKLRDIIGRLQNMGETVKADDLTGQLRTAKDDTLRRLRDKLDLFEGDADIIKFGDYRFTVNTQPLELTTVLRDGEMYFHLTGTSFYEPIDDPAFLETRHLWRQELVSESREVYRAEFLAFRILRAAVNKQNGLSLQKLESVREEDADRLELVRTFAADRYNEGYEKGIHDHDASRILAELIRLYTTTALLRYDSTSRAHAMIFWCYFENQKLRDLLRERMRSFGALPKVFGISDVRTSYIDDIRVAMAGFFEGMHRPAPPAVLTRAAEFLYYELQDAEELEFTVNALAWELHERFLAFLKKRRSLCRFQRDIDCQKSDPSSRLNLIYDWVSAYCRTQEDENAKHFEWEVVALLTAGDVINRDLTSVSTYVEIDDMLGAHPLIQDKVLPLHFDRFLLKMTRFLEVQAPLFERFTALRASLTEKRRAEMRLAEFQSRVMGGFVRNRLINDVYLNLVGANFAKQMGVVGEGKRTDLMGLLLLVSPPGYGKTTLMEYIANRLGLTFMKINGPAIGHRVTSLDPAEAPNATAREELGKLNLAFEMGNNIMIYLDDIQHLNPEFLQKFISLCDAQRKIEGVYRGVTRTYDLRGRKVGVVMAGNPYTESGEKFKIPDMLANRADTYNLGDIGGTNAEAFAMSFVENAMTSNPTLGRIASQGHEDVYRFLQILQTGSKEGIDLQHNYSADEVDEILSVLRKLLRIRDIVLKVNAAYIASAAQQDEYRTEPPFRLQGSYRNMNRMAEKVYPVMTDGEVDQLIFDHYRNEAQTLTSGAEANLLKFKEIMESMTTEEQERWDRIKAEFNRRQTLAGMDGMDDLGKILAQLSGLTAGVGSVGQAVGSGVSRLTASLQQLAENSPTIDLGPLTATLEQKVGMPLEAGVDRLTGTLADLAKRPQPLKLGPVLKALKTIELQSESYVMLKDVLQGVLDGKITVEVSHTD